MFLLLLSQCFASQASPGIQDVLKRPMFSVDFMAAVIGFFALSLSTLSAAKVYSTFKKSSEKKEKIDNSVIDSLKLELTKINCDMRYKDEESENLKEQISRLEEAIKEKSQSEEVYRKSINNLKKECERLLEDKEKLNLEINKKTWAEFFPEKKAEAVKTSELPILGKIVEGKKAKVAIVKKTKLKNASKKNRAIKKAPHQKLENPIAARKRKK